MIRFKKDDGSAYPKWENKKLGTITERVIVGLATSVTPYYREKGVPILRNLNIKENRLDDSDMLYLDEEYAKKQTGKIIHAGDVLTVHTGSNIGLTCLAPEKYEGCLSFTTLITTPRKDILDSEYLSQYMNSPLGVNRINTLTTAGGKPNLNSGDLVNLSVPVPHIEEQKRISNLLSLVDEVITESEKEVANLEEQKKGAMQKIFSQVVRFKADDGSAYPEWEEKGFYSVFDLFQTNTFSRDMLNDEKGEVFDIHYGDVLTKYGSVLDCSVVKLPYINENIFIEKYNEDSYVQEGDIILADTAEDFTAGKVSEVISVGNKKILSGLHTMLCRPKFEMAPMYLGHYMNTEKYHKQVVTLLVGTKVYSINKKVIERTTLEIPCLDEQKKIADCLSDFDTAIEEAKKELECWKQIKKGLLQQMFV